LPQQSAPATAQLLTPAETQVVNTIIADAKYDGQEFLFGFSTATSSVSSRWVLDSGATRCATFEESDCVDVRDCDVTVTAAGCTFTVQKIGTAIVPALDESGRIITLRMTDTLISPQFAHKLIALQAFTRKGHSVSMTHDCIRVTNSLNPVV